MAMLDLQKMGAPKEKAPSGSRASKGCHISNHGGPSGYSLLLC
jgi:SapB morphogen precursor RamS